MKSRGAMEHWKINYSDYKIEIAIHPNQGLNQGYISVIIWRAGIAGLLPNKWKRIVISRIYRFSFALSLRCVGNTFIKVTWSEWWPYTNKENVLIRRWFSSKFQLVDVRNISTVQYSCLVASGVLQKRKPLESFISETPLSAFCMHERKKKASLLLVSYLMKATNQIFCVFWIKYLYRASIFFFRTVRYSNGFTSVCSCSYTYSLLCFAVLAACCVLRAVTVSVHGESLVVLGTQNTGHTISTPPKIGEKDNFLWWHLLWRWMQ